MADEPKSKKKTGLIIGGVILLLLILFYLAYRKGKKTVTLAKLPVDDPKLGQQSSAVGGAVVSQIVTDLYNDMKGVNWFAAHNIEPYNQLMSLSDTDFTKAYNFWNTKYQVQEGGGLDNTLTGWIKSQSSIWYSPFETVRTAILKRLGKLNLS